MDQTATTQVAGYACLEQFYEPDITTHGEVRESFLTPDGRGQLVAVGAQPQMIKIHCPSPPHAAVPLDGVVPWAFFCPFWSNCLGCFACSPFSLLPLMFSLLVERSCNSFFCRSSTGSSEGLLPPPEMLPSSKAYPQAHG